MNYSKLILAFLLSPLTAPLTVFVVQMFRDQSAFKSSNFILNFIVYGLISYAATALIGVPFVYLFKILKLKNIIGFLLSGAIAGLIVAYCLSILLPTPGRVNGNAELYEYLMYCAAGLLTGLAFWLILYGFKFKRSSAMKFE